MNLRKIVDSLKTLPPDKQLENIKKLSSQLSVDQKREIQLIAESTNPPWIRNALINTFKENRSNLISGLATCVEPKDAYNIREIKSEAVAESIGHIVHELQPIVGALELAASKEVDSYDSSITRSEIERLQDLIDMFSLWRKAEQKPNFSLLNLNQIIKEETARINVEKTQVAFDISIPENLLFQLDNGLIRTVISNALRNAVESSNQVIGRDVAPIIIRANCTDNNFWLSIIDNGVGISNPESILVKNRFTTKPGNSGFGLAIIDKSIESMGGTWKIDNSATGGAVFYLEIPRRES